MNHDCLEVFESRPAELKAKRIAVDVCSRDSFVLFEVHDRLGRVLVNIIFRENLGRFSTVVDAFQKLVSRN